MQFNISRRFTIKTVIMRHIYYLKIILIILHISIFELNAQISEIGKVRRLDNLIELAKCSKWDVAKVKDGIELSYRWLNFGDTLKIRQMSSSFTTSSGIDAIINNLKKQNSLKVWNKNLGEIRVLESCDTSWVTHIVYDIPFPFPQQDLIVMHNVSKSETGSVVISMSAIPDYIKPLKNINRQQHYLGSWTICPISEGRTEIVFSAVSMANSRIPRFLKDPVVQYKMFNSFLKLKELSNGCLSLAKQ